MVRKKSWREKLTNSKDLLRRLSDNSVRGEVVAVQVPDHLIPR